MREQFKSLASDTLIYGLFTVVGRFLTFILTPFYSNYLNTQEYDFISYTFALIAFMNILYSFGMESAFFRFYNYEDEDESKKVFSQSIIFIMIIGAIITFLTLILSNVIGTRISEIPEATNWIRIAAFIPFVDALLLIPFAYLRMTKQAKKFATIKFTQIIIATFTTILFIVSFKAGAFGVIIAAIISSIAGLIVFIPVYRENIIPKIDKKLIDDMLKFGLPTLPASFSAIILQVADRPIIKELTHSSMAIVTYNVNYRLGIPMMMLATVFEYSWKPFYLTHFKDKEAKQLFSRILTYFTLASAGVFLITSFFIEYIVKLPFIGGRFINPIYWEGLSIIPIILGAYFFNGVYINFTAGLLIEKKTKYLPIAVGVAAVINVLANFILIPILSYRGAAWATFVAYLASAIVMYYYSNKFYPMDYEWKRIGIIITLTLLVFFADKMIVLNGFIEFVSKLGLIAIFLILLFFMKFFDKEELYSLKILLKRK